MNTISCIIVDDEPLAVKLMESYVEKIPFLELKGSFTSGKSAFAFLQENPVELLFCDIQMPNLSGMDLSKMLPEGTRVIFTTAFSQYAVEGFKVHALDYLLKPISYDDFLTAARHAAKVISEKPSTETAKDDSPKSIFVKTEYKLQQIELDRITFIEGLKDYVKIHLDDGLSFVLAVAEPFLGREIHGIDPPEYGAVLLEFYLEPVEILCILQGDDEFNVPCVHGYLLSLPPRPAVSINTQAPR